MNRLTPVVKNLLIINVLVWLSMFLLGSKFADLPREMALYKTNLLNLYDTTPEGNFIVETDEGPRFIPYSANDFEPYQLVTHFFMHSQRSFFHILFNMILLFSLGPLVEMVMGSQRFLKFYLFSGFVGGIFVALFDPSPNPVVGASGALSGVLLAFAWFFPNEKLIIFPIPIPIKARSLVIGFAAISLALVVYSGQTGGISHFGHLAGMAAGALFLFGKGVIKKISG